MKIFQSAGHFFASIAHGIVKAASVIANAAPIVAKDAAVAEPIVEAISGVVLGPAAQSIERLAFQLLGNGIAVVGEGQQAVDAKGLNIPLDEQLIADLKALAPQFQTLAAALGISKPTGVPTITPVLKAATVVPAGGGGGAGYPPATP